MKKLFSILVSGAILYAVYQKIDTPTLLRVLAGSDQGLLSISFLMVIPITFLTVTRFRLIAPPEARVNLAEGTRLILAGCSLNMVLPSKMGDLAKAYFMQKEKSLAAPLAFGLVVYEKVSDLLALMAWCLLSLLLFAGDKYRMASVAVSTAFAIGIVLLTSMNTARFTFSSLRKVAPGKVAEKVSRFQETWEAVLNYTTCNRLTAIRIAAFSLFIWLLHLTQIWLFILSLRAFVPFHASLALTSLAIFAGLLPFTFAGVGTRDAAIITLYLPYFDAATGAALGILCTMRYVIPALFGLPYLKAYLAGNEKPRRTNR